VAGHESVPCPVVVLAQGGEFDGIRFLAGHHFERLAEVAQRQSARGKADQFYPVILADSSAVPTGLGFHFLGGPPRTYVRGYCLSSLRDCVPFRREFAA